MTAIGLGDIEAFPFLDPPDRRAITDGIRLLEELGALEPEDEPTGRTRPPAPHRRSAAAWPACRSTPASGAWCWRPGAAGLPARGADHRRRPVDPGPPRAAGRAARARPTSSTPASPRATATSSPSSTCGTTCASSSASSRRATASGGCAATSTSTSCASGSGPDVHSQLRRIVADLGMTQNREDGRTGRGAPGAAGRPAHPRRPEGRRHPRVPRAPATPASPSSPARRCRRSRRRG